MQIDEPDHPLAPYDLIGGDAVVFELVKRFYDLMDEDPDYYSIRKMHPSSLAGSREKFFKFLTGWLGGPPLYEQEFGHPRLRARHLPFAIGEAERDQWLACMQQAMQALGITPGLCQELTQAFAKTADHMRNQAL